MDLGISGKRAAVAAASAGLGLATAKALVAEGVQVAICGRDEARLAAAVALLGPSVIAIHADVSDTSGATAFVEEAIARLGGLDILVANCGGPPTGNFATTDLDAYRKAFESNTLSSVAMCQAAIPGMQAQRWGRVVAITSVVVKQPAPYLILSNTARSALTAFLKSTSLVVGPDNVTVNSIMPGSHATDRIRHLYGDEPDVSGNPMRALGRPDDFGAVAAFLCSDQARYITGTSVVVDGGGYPGLF